MAAKPKYNAPYHDNWAWSLAAMGATNEEIALAMGVSERTIIPGTGLPGFHQLSRVSKRAYDPQGL